MPSKKDKNLSTRSMSSALTDTASSDGGGGLLSGLLPGGGLGSGLLGGGLLEGLIPGSGVDAVDDDDDDSSREERQTDMI